MALTDKFSSEPVLEKNELVKNGVRSSEGKIQSTYLGGHENEKAQQPTYGDPVELNRVTERLRRSPALVPTREIELLKKHIELASEGKSFILQGGPCAETFSDFSVRSVWSTTRTLLRAAQAVTSATGQPVVKVGRMAGQFAKPRSSTTEVIGDLALPSYRGDIINSAKFCEAARLPDPQRMIVAYDQSFETLEILRKFMPAYLTVVNSSSGADSAVKKKKHSTGGTKPKSLHKPKYIFNRECEDASVLYDPEVNLSKNFFVSHEALLLPYESAFIRTDEATGRAYLHSTHFPWIGERTRQLDGAHVQLLAGVSNPIGVKISHKIKPGELIRLLDRLNPDNRNGRITLIVRMGRRKVAGLLPALIREVQREGRKVCWLVDPMHGNTIVLSSGLKTRRVCDIRAEMEDFYLCHEAERTVAAGVHLEMTGGYVTECIDEENGISEADVGERYETVCDPRLNRDQVVGLMTGFADDFLSSLGRKNYG